MIKENNASSKQLEAQRPGGISIIGAVVAAFIQPLQADIISVDRTSIKDSDISQAITAPNLENIAPLQLGDLPNGCLPRSIIFNDYVASKRSGLLSRIIITKGGRHAILLCMENQKIYAYDGYLGSFYISSDQTILNKPNELYNNIEKKLKLQSFRSQKQGTYILEPVCERNKITRERALNAVINLVKIMEMKRMPFAVLIEAPKGENYPCATFLYNGKIYLYSPQSGTASHEVPDEETNLYNLIHIVASKKYGSGVKISNLSP